MKKITFWLIFNLGFINVVFSQDGVGINTTGAPADKSAILDVSSTDKGLLIPRMSTANRPANPVESLIIYNTDKQCFEAYNAATSQWVNVACIGGFKCGDNVTDTRDGMVYSTVQISTQCWFKVNLNTTKFRNGDAIPNVTDNIEWTKLTTGAYSDYDNNGDDVEQFF